MALVVDASIILASYFPDEESELADRVVGRLSLEASVAPPIWPLEIANGLLQSQRRGRTSQAETERMLQLVSDLPVEVEPPSFDISARAMAVARANGLTAYDAAYLELAMRRGLPLATLDGDLRAAAKRVGVELAL